MPGARAVEVPFPEQVGRYEVLLPIASGGMATVYLARSRGAGGFERDVALKLTHAHLRESADFAQELIEEGKLAVRIRHANVVAVLDIGDDPHGLFLVMEYIEGDTLSGLARRATVAGTRLDPAVSLRILLDGLAGLHAAHELADDDGRPLNLVHRDSSPQNILVGIDGVGRLSDFGIAKAASRLGATRTGIVKGKIGYMSPEQARGQPVDRRCDVWAAGVLAWEMIAGRQLYVAAADEIGLLFRIATEEPPRLADVCDVPPAVDEAVAHALTRDVDARAPTAAAFRRELFEALRGASIDVAEPGDVATVVTRLCASKLTERRARVKEVLRRRAARAEGQDPSDIAATLLLAPVSVRNPPSRTDVTAVPAPSAMPSALPQPARSRAPVIAAAVGVVVVVAAVVARSIFAHSAPSAVPVPPATDVSLPLMPSSLEPPAATVEPSATASAPASASAALPKPSPAVPQGAASARSRWDPKPGSSARQPKHHDSFLDDQY